MFVSVHVQAKFVYLKQFIIIMLLNFIYLLMFLCKKNINGVEVGEKLNIFVQWFGGFINFIYLYKHIKAQGVQQVFF